MISRRFTRWQKLTALAPVLLVLAYLPAETMLRCRMDSSLRATCCCPHVAEIEASGPAIKAQDCCDRVVAHNDTRPAADVSRPASRDLLDIAAVAIVAPALPVLAPPIDRPTAAAQRHGPRGEGPPLVLVKHAFLI